MRLEEVDGQLLAYKSSIDVINGLNEFNSFCVSTQVANELRKSSSFLEDDYWYLTIGRNMGTGPFLWEITAYNSSPQIPLKGIVKFESGFPVLFLD